MNIDFVPAKASDAVTISTLRQKIWDTTYRGIYPDAVIDDFDYDWHQQRDLKKISDPSFTVYLIKYGDEILDISFFRMLAPVYGYIPCMCCGNISAEGSGNGLFLS